jgi:hypothetical protein
VSEGKKGSEGGREGRCAWMCGCVIMHMVCVCYCVVYVCTCEGGRGQEVGHAVRVVLLYLWLTVLFCPSVL